MRGEGVAPCLVQPRRWRVGRPQVYGSCRVVLAEKLSVGAAPFRAGQLGADQEYPTSHNAYPAVAEVGQLDPSTESGLSLPANAPSAFPMRVRWVVTCSSAVAI